MSSHGIRKLCVHSNFSHFFALSLKICLKFVTDHLMHHRRCGYTLRGIFSHSTLTFYAKKSKFFWYASVPLFLRKKVRILVNMGRIVSGLDASVRKFMQGFYWCLFKWDCQLTAKVFWNYCRFLVSLWVIFTHLFSIWTIIKGFRFLCRVVFCTNWFMIHLRTRIPVLMLAFLSYGRIY